MCHPHHVGGNDAFHELGRKKFEDHFGLDLNELIVQHIIRFLEEELQFGDRD